MQKKSRWKAFFVLSTPVSVGEVKSVPNIEFVVESHDKIRKISGINVTAPKMSHIDAVNYAEITCNRCVDYPCFLTGVPVTASLRQMSELGAKTAVKTGFAFMSADVLIAKRADLDITTQAFQRALLGEDLTLALQLAHFRRGMLARDVIEKIRELYQILELEDPSIAEAYKYVRHLVSHPKLTWSAEEAKEILGKPYFDPSAPQDLRKIESDALKIEKQARSIIQNKLRK